MREVGWGACRLNARVWVRAGKGEHLGKHATGLCERRGPFSVPKPHAPPWPPLGRGRAGRKATLHSWTQRHNSPPSSPLIRRVDLKGANGEGVGRAADSRASSPSQARPSPCGQNRFRLCSYLGLWLWKALLAPLTGGSAGPRGSDAASTSAPRGGEAGAHLALRSGQPRRPHPSRRGPCPGSEQGLASGPGSESQELGWD